MNKAFCRVSFLALLVLLFSVQAIASPLPPLPAINEETMQCTRFGMGDECYGCVLPEGWIAIVEYEEDELGIVPIGNWDVNCPEGYEVLPTYSVRAVCKPAKNQFCCSENHSGGAGDCSDLVVNYAGRKCAFVEDIKECDSLPLVWGQTSICPLGYEWMESQLECSSGAGPTPPAGNWQGFSQVLVYALVVLVIAFVAFKKLKK